MGSGQYAVMAAATSLETIVLGVIYVLAVLFAYRASLPNVPLAMLRFSPLVSDSNWTSTTHRRWNDLKADVKLAMESKDWKILRRSGGSGAERITIEILRARVGLWPQWIRSTTTLPISPEALQGIFSWENEQYDKTSKLLDPYLFSKAQSLSNWRAGKARLIRREARRFLATPRREFIGALIETSQKGDVQVGDYTLKGGAPAQVFISVRSSHPFSSASIQAFQESVTWFGSGSTHDETKFITLSRTDLGGDVPHWLLTCFVSASGVQSLRRLQSRAKAIKLQREKELEENRKLAMDA